MDALDHEDVLLAELQEVAAVDPFPEFEVKDRKLHFLSVEQIVHVVGEKLQVQRLQDVKIVVSVLVDRGLLPVDEVVVHADDVRL